MFKTIMVPTDGSEFASRAEDVAIYLAKKLHAKVLAVYVIDEKLIYPYEVLEDEGKSILKNVGKKGEEQGVKIKEVLVVGHPAHDLARIATNENADLIVIGTHGKTELEKLLMGSVAKSTLNSAKIPVLLVK
ncbi:MAG: universal stress protein [Euryarchaeota archaeon]|nr:universal stress protein [Euryarchaeota archaeon]